MSNTPDQDRVEPIPGACEVKRRIILSVWVEVPNDKNFVSDGTDSLNDLWERGDALAKEIVEFLRESNADFEDYNAEVCEVEEDFE